MEIHYINVGCGNMTLLLFPDGTTWLYDCNVTEENEKAVLGYLAKAMGQRKTIRAFICSHRDADHMRGVKKVHKTFPIGGIFDNGVAGTTTDSPEYLDYMDLRRQLENGEIQGGTQTTIGEAVVTWMNSKDPNFSTGNDQSIVAKVDFKGSSTLLTADTTYLPWKNKLVRLYGDKLKTNLLLGAHHGSITFFDDPGDMQYYTAHIDRMKPEMTLVSVGPNSHGLPDKEAIELYKTKSSGARNGDKVYTTEDQGNMKLTLRGGGLWSLSANE